MVKIRSYYEKKKKKKNENFCLSELMQRVYAFFNMKINIYVKMTRVFTI